MSRPGQKKMRPSYTKNGSGVQLRRLMPKKLEQLHKKLMRGHVDRMKIKERCEDIRDIISDVDNMITLAEVANELTDIIKMFQEEVP